MKSNAFGECQPPPVDMWPHYVLCASVFLCLSVQYGLLTNSTIKPKLVRTLLFQKVHVVQCCADDRLLCRHWAFISACLLYVYQRQTTIRRQRLTHSCRMWTDKDLIMSKYTWAYRKRQLQQLLGHRRLNGSTTTTMLVVVYHLQSSGP